VGLEAELGGVFLDYALGAGVVAPELTTLLSARTAITNNFVRPHWRLPGRTPSGGRGQTVDTVTRCPKARCHAPTTRINGLDLAHKQFKRPAHSLDDEEDTCAIYVKLEHRILPESVKRGSRLLGCVWTQSALHFENQPLMHVITMLNGDDVRSKIVLCESTARVAVQRDLKTFYPNITAFLVDCCEPVFGRDGGNLTSTMRMKSPEPFKIKRINHCSESTRSAVSSVRPRATATYSSSGIPHFGSIVSTVI